MKQKDSFFNFFYKLHIVRFIFVQIMAQMNFKTWIPLDTDKSGKILFFEKEIKLLNKETGQEELVKRKFLHGVASNTVVDKEREQVSPNFIRKMQESALGLNVFLEHKHTLENTLGTVSEVGGDENNFSATTMLEPEDDNALVKSLLKKSENGIKFGYSIGGIVSKTSIASDEQGSYKVLEDGELLELSITAMPAGRETWVETIMKSLDPDKKQNIRDEDEVTFVHTSKLLDNEPSWDKVDKSALPKEAFALRSGDKSDWKHPHHWVSGGSIKDEQGIWKDGTMFLHKGGLIAAWAETDSSAKSHLQAQRQVIGITEKQMDRFAKSYKESNKSLDHLAKVLSVQTVMNKVMKSATSETSLTKALEEMVEVDAIRDQMFDFWWAFRDAISMITFDEDLDPSQKEEKIKAVANEYAAKILELSEQLANLTSIISETLE